MLRRYTQAAAQSVEERCDLCGEPIPPEHRHLLDVTPRQIRCVCRPCSILFDRREASQGTYRLIPERRLALNDFRMSDAQWERLRIPVGMAFFTESTPDRRVVAFYPGPMGPTQSMLEFAAWAELTLDNPILMTLEPDVEALLINRARGAEQYFLVPIDDCFRLVGLIRLNWRGLSGGREVWDEINRFFADLTRQAKVAYVRHIP